MASPADKAFILHLHHYHNCTGKLFVGILDELVRGIELLLNQTFSLHRHINGCASTNEVLCIFKSSVLRTFDAGNLSVPVQLFVISFVLSHSEQCNIVFLKGEKVLVFKEHIRVQGIPTSIHKEALLGICFGILGMPLLNLITTSITF